MTREESGPASLANARKEGARRAFPPSRPRDDPEGVSSGRGFPSPGKAQALGYFLKTLVLNHLPLRKEIPHWQPSSQLQPAGFTGFVSLILISC